MNESRAKGGPLDGVALQAPSRWDGRVKHDAGGRYVWRVDAWCWVADRATTATTVKRRRRSK